CFRASPPRRSADLVVPWGISGPFRAGWYPSRAEISRIFSRASWLTISGRRRARETVATDTPACSATSRSVTLTSSLLSPPSVIVASQPSHASVPRAGSAPTDRNRPEPTRTDRAAPDGPFGADGNPQHGIGAGPLTGARTASRPGPTGSARRPPAPARDNPAGCP